jgi:hypothetical protein
MLLVVYVLLPGSTRSGENARKKSRSTSSPEDRQRDLVGGAWVGRGFQNDELSLSQVRGHDVERLNDERQIRVLRFSERRRHADIHDVYVAQLREIGRRVESSLRYDVTQLIL